MKSVSCFVTSWLHCFTIQNYYETFARYSDDVLFYLHCVRPQADV